MILSGKMIVMFMVIALLLFAPFLSTSACAQTLGILSKPQQKPQQKVLSSAKGRFVFGQVSDSSKDKFMLDTWSGRLWQIAESGKVGIYLRNVPYRTEEREYLPLPDDISDLTSKEPKKDK